MSNTSRQFGLLAQFDTPAEVMEAARQVRDAGYKRWDVYTPFPVHGMDSAMGLRNSRVGWFAFIGGASGFFLGMLMIWWMNASDYSLVVGGKPLFSPIFAFRVSTTPSSKANASVKRPMTSSSSPSNRPIRNSMTRTPAASWKWRVGSTSRK
jgi:hypothetical protein